MAVARQAPQSRVRPRHVLLAGALVAGWSVARATAKPPPACPADSATSPAPDASRPVARPQRAPQRRKRSLLALAGIGVTLLAGVGVLTSPDEARAPLVAPAVAAREQALAAKQAEAARLGLLRHLELAGIAARRVGLPEQPVRHAQPFRPAVRPSDRAIALATYVQALSTNTILVGLDASRDALQQQVLSDPRLHIYPGGRGDVTSGKLDVRVLALIEYLAQANGEVTVSCLITGHSLYVHGRPGVVSAHIYGRAVDIAAVGGTPILGHQGPGSVTERTIEQILALPDSVEPQQVISLMTLGGPSFALPDHYDHIHVGY